MAEHDYNNAFQKARNEILESRRIDLSKARVLILGCGYNYPDVALWSSIADHAVGVDVRKVFLRNRLTALNRYHRSIGCGVLEALARTAIAGLTYGPYYRYLRNASGKELDEHHQDLIVYDGTNLPFADESFDIVCSNAVLEHVSELGVVSKELKRVTKPLGVCLHVWHNFYALSGGHVPDDLTVASPWGHLLGDVSVNSWLRFTGTYLNRRLPNEIIETLADDFAALKTYQLDRNYNRKGLDEDFEYEGVNLLTGNLARALSEYPRDTLLTRAYSFVGIRK